MRRALLEGAPQFEPPTAQGLVIALNDKATVIDLSPDCFWLCR